MKVYSKPGCVGCYATELHLGRKGYEAEIIDVTQDTDAFEFVASLGASGVPVVVTDDGDHWIGYRPDLLNEAIVTGR